MAGPLRWPTANSSCTPPVASSEKTQGETMSSSFITVPSYSSEFNQESIPIPISTAIIYCEANFGLIDGKTANGLIRHSEKYQILSVIDSEKAGKDTGFILDGETNNIPVCRDLKDSLAQSKATPGFFIFGMAPSSGMLSKHHRLILLEAMNKGMNIVIGLHEYLNDDPVFVAACKTNNVHIQDIRKPRDSKDLRMFSGRIHEVNCPRIAVLGTDCAIGKRTTATILTKALNKQGIKAIMIGTGQTGLMQGARYGIALDAIPSQFCAGELEATIVEAYHNEKPDIIIIEGQGALSHPAFSSTAFILRGACPNGIILQHAPGRSHRCDFPKMPMPSPEDEINLLETFASTKVIGLTINHEKMTDQKMYDTIAHYEKELQIPVLDPFTQESNLLTDMITKVFTTIGDKLSAHKI